MKIDNKGWGIALRRLLLMGILFAVTTSFLSCDSTGYKTFSFEHRIEPNYQYPVEYVTRFSFEYPRDYRRISTYAKPDPVPPIEVTFGRGTSFFSRRGMDSKFEVSLSSAIYAQPTPEVAIEEMLSGLQGGTQPLERSSVSVAGLPGELVVFRSKGNGDLANLPEIECRCVFFEAGERSWRICMCADASRADQAKLEFDHIVETFQILD